MRSRSSYSLAALGLLALLGCSGSGGGMTDPVLSTTPDLAPAPPAPTTLSAARLPDNVAYFGAWDIAIDPATLNFEVAPVREAAAFGDNYWINATGYLDGVPCGDCFALRSLRRDLDGHIVVTAAVRHPFAPGDTALPVSAVNRLDLHVFDAQLLVSGDGNNTNWDFGGSNVIVPSNLVLDADGYSDLLSSAVALPGGTATAFPFVTIAEDPTAGNFAASNPGGFADLAAPTGHNVFAMGSEHTTSFTLGAEEGDSFRFRAYFLANYGVSAASRAERLTPRYALPEYHTKAAWKVEAEVPAATNDLTQGDPGSTAEVEVRVWDWQPGASVDATLASLDAIRASSDVASVKVAAPGVMTADVDLGAPVSGTGPLDDPLVYQGTIINNDGGTLGDYFAIVEVVDSRTPGLNSGGQTDGLSNQTGTDLQPVAITAFRTYQLAPFSVSGRTLLSIAITPNTRQIIDQGAGNAIAFTATGTYDLPPLTEDITSTVTWDSSAVDVGIFGGDNTLEGVGMGVTNVTATLDSITSPATQVIVKPQLFQTTPLSIPQAIDPNQTTGNFYINSGATLQVYNDAGVFQTSFGVPFTPREISVDETTGNIWGVRSGNPPTLNTFQVTNTGATVNQLSVTNQFGPNGMTFTGNGELWMPEFVFSITPMNRYDTTTGARLGGFTFPGPFPVLIGINEKDGVFVICDPGNRVGGPTLHIANQATQTQVASGATSYAPNYPQNNYVDFDRDNFIHMTIGGDSAQGFPARVQVFEFNTSSGTVSSLYTYAPGTLFSIDLGIGVYRTNNVVAFGDLQTSPFVSRVFFLD